MNFGENTSIQSTAVGEIRDFQVFIVDVRNRFVLTIWGHSGSVRLAKVFWRQPLPCKNIVKVLCNPYPFGWCWRTDPLMILYPITNSENANYNINWLLLGAYDNYAVNSHEQCSNTNQGRKLGLHVSLHDV